ncbi:chordin [Microcaecilia unicolor]|uniref:Chordin n=1 Tax=Microcaecilia unicolor TaxID=1415580 RepID=A0A6P7Z5Y2_9AMPH|nr:chordin [Microcaecilia unicolor]
MQPSVLPLLFLVLFVWPQIGAFSRAKSLLPIQPEQDPASHRPLAGAGCSFGGRYYALEELWNPDLGEPFGVMHCVLCSCEPQRTRRGKATGKVYCKNIREDCLSLACSDPVLQQGHCCKSCPKVASTVSQKRSRFLSDDSEHLEKEDELHNDQTYLSSDEVSQDDSRSEFVALLTSSPRSWSPASSGVAKARFTLLRSSLTFSINYERLGQPIRVRFSDSDGSVLFEHPVQRMLSPQDNMICGMWRNLQRSTLQLLRTAQIFVSLMTGRAEGELHGKIIKHRALFAETFSALLKPVDTGYLGTGGIAMLALSDVEDSLHFVLMSKGLLDRAGKSYSSVPLRIQILHQKQLLREIRASVTAEDSDFAEVLTNLSSLEMFWLAQGQLRISVEVEGRQNLRISGYITVKKSCDTIQSVLSGGDSLIPTKTGAVGSAKFMLQNNGTLEYQVQVAGTTSEVIRITLETKPRRKNKRNVLYDLSQDYRNGQAAGTWELMNARDVHMLLQSELFLSVATKDCEEEELRGQILPLLYSGLLARYQDFPVLLAGQFVYPPVRTSSAGHAWVSLDEHCHLHYEIVVGGLGKAEDGTLQAHLHGFAEIGEFDGSSQEHKRLLKGFYGSEAQGILKDLSSELLQHLNKGTAFIQVSTKAHPQGEIRGRVLLPNRCESAALLVAPHHTEHEHKLFEEGKPTDPEEVKKTHNSCFFEGQLRPHGTSWAPNYDKKCSVCSCQKRTVICDPVICQPLNCSFPVYLDDHCCPVCEEKKDSPEIKGAEKPELSGEGCYYDGDRSWRAAGTRWHPVVPPFGLIKCAICTCRGVTGEVHCEKVQCPLLSCSNPIRVTPSDCCKRCQEEKSALELSDMMQSDAPRACKFGRHWYLNNERWHPTVPPFGEMKCVTCWCVEGVTQCQRQDCSNVICNSTVNAENRCCSKCKESFSHEVQEKLKEEGKRSNWSR